MAGAPAPARRRGEGGRSLVEPQLFVCSAQARPDAGDGSPGTELMEPTRAEAEVPRAAQPGLWPFRACARATPGPRSLRERADGAVLAGPVGAEPLVGEAARGPGAGTRQGGRSCAGIPGSPGRVEGWALRPAPRDAEARSPESGFSAECRHSFQGKVTVERGTGGTLVWPRGIWSQRSK